MFSVFLPVITLRIDFVQYSRITSNDVYVIWTPAGFLYSYISNRRMTENNINIST